MHLLRNIIWFFPYEVLVFLFRKTYNWRKKGFPSLKTPPATSFFVIMQADASWTFVVFKQNYRTSDQGKKSKNPPFGSHVCLWDFQSREGQLIWVLRYGLTNQTKVSFALTQSIPLHSWRNRGLKVSCGHFQFLWSLFPIWYDYVSSRDHSSRSWSLQWAF